MMERPGGRFRARWGDATVAAPTPRAVAGQGAATGARGTCPAQPSGGAQRWRGRPTPAGVVSTSLGPPSSTDRPSPTPSAMRGDAGAVEADTRGRAAGARAGAVLAHALGCVVLLAVLLLAGPAVSQSLAMRSGEHPRFTRLTLPLPAAQPWELGRTEDGYGLRLPDLDRPIDATGVFARIPRTRIAGLRPVSDGIDLVLGCADCHANAFEERGLLVIDIRDGAPPSLSRFEARLGAPARAPRQLRAGFDWTRQFATMPARDELPSEEGAEVADLSRPVLEMAGPARDLLVRQLARAAAQGLIGADGDAGLSAHGLQPGKGGYDAQKLLGLAQEALRALQLDAQTGLDLAQRSRFEAGTDRDGGRCPADRLFDVAAWADHRPLLRQIAHRRSGLLAEFDRPVPEAVEALARLYIHTGFGAEAVDLLTNLPVPEDGFLLDMARVLDEGRPAPGSALAAHVGCDGPVAMWAVLAAEDLRTVGVIDREAVQRGFSALPPHLRRHLGPPLAQRFIALGDAETAQAIRNTVARVDGGDRLLLLDAELDMAHGRPAAAGDRAAPVARGSSVGAPEALAVMVEARIAAGQPVAPGTVSDLIALAQEHRGTALGDRLARLEALALTDEGRFDAAFAVRDRIARQSDGAIDTERLTLDLLTRLAERADEETFLRRALAEPGWRGGRLPPDARVDLARRLLDAGFPEETLEAFASPDQDDVAAAVVQASAALALGRPGQALRALAGRDGAEAMELRAQALLAMGDHRAAAGFLRDVGQEAAAVEAAWLGGDWATVAREAEGAVGQLAARAQPSRPDRAAGPEIAPVDDASDGPPWPPVPSEGALAEARSLLEVSAELRAVVAEALAAHPPPTR